VAAED
jgi:hypothetical protein